MKADYKVIYLVFLNLSAEIYHQRQFLLNHVAKFSKTSGLYEKVNFLATTPAYSVNARMLISAFPVGLRLSDYGIFARLSNR